MRKNYFETGGTKNLPLRLAEISDQIGDFQIGRRARRGEPRGRTPWQQGLARAGGEVVALCRKLAREKHREAAAAECLSPTLRRKASCRTPPKVAG